MPLSFTNILKHWYFPLITGIIFTILGFYIFTIPIQNYILLAIFFSMSFLILGLSDIVFAVQNSNSLNGWGWYLVSGILSLVIGMHLSIDDSISISALIYIVSFTLMFRSFLTLGFSIDLSEMDINNWEPLAFLSIAGVIPTFILIANPLLSGSFLVNLTAISFILCGISTIYLAFRLKKIKNRNEEN
ncbi:hypothetical protein CMU54_16785 [Elizabethkingia anophelis]|jgi:uncharacterized membrane protein HdeD (DUF308 family)|uniref:HdeD family acid-resistance protein n=1 Tax=Elizabethkingia TaxID=308865 RepID=UPI00099A3067|nr:MULTISPECIES: DUF308 domain-containing protein [Elizabethkingia]MCL1673015.1 DUF308 domain-containing protein [Elizabethkingia ursingii]MDV3610691.1 hypothetical protein [Elizabethkingia anophelis]MDV3698987.1 hypothetical protein [Elizabethkingia anophelis]